MEKPNIILIVVDSLRSDHLGCYNYERETSPYLDSLAEKGLKFENCYTNSFWSVPAHASLFTEELPSKHRIVSENKPHFNQENKLVKRFKQKGYTTYGNSNNIWINPFYGFDRDFDYFDHQMWSSELGEDGAKELLKDIQSNNWDSRKQKYLYTLKSSLERPKTLLRLLSYKFEKAIGRKIGLFDFGTKKTFKNIKKTSKQTKRPLFAFTNLMEVHASYMPPISFERKFSSRYLPKKGVIDASKKVNEQELQERINLYDDCIRYVDSKIEEFIEDFKQENPNTLFIITSDHGELFFDNHLEFEDEKQGHNPSCSDNLLKVPLIIYKKGGIDAKYDKSPQAMSLKDLGSLLQDYIEEGNIATKGFAISENISEKETSRQITDGENKTVTHDEKKYLFGDRTKCRKLLDKLDELPKLNKPEQEYINDIDI